jgi:hypothetical protein
VTRPVTVELPMSLPSANNLHELPYARAGRVKNQRNATRFALHDWKHYDDMKRLKGLLAELRLVVKLTRGAARELDDDNLQGAFKAVRDEVAAFFGIDDGDRQRIRFEYFAERAKPPVVRIELGVEGRQ